MFLYFGLGSVALVACLVGFSCIERFRDVSDDYLVIFGGDDDSTSLGAVVTSGLELHCGVHDVHAREDSTTQDERKHSLSDPTFVDSTQQPEITLSGIDEDEDCSLENNIPSDRNNVDFFSSFRSHHEQRILESFSVWKQVQEPVICIFLTFFVTLSLFPGLTSALYSVRRCHSQYRIFNDLYVPFGFVLFNIGDLSGRLLFSRFSLTGVRNLSTKLVVASCLRCVFFPLLFICNGGNHIHGDSSWRVPSDLYSCLVQLSLAVSNGYLLSAAFALAPSLVPQDVRKQEHMSKLLSAAVAFGLFFGSLLSFPVSTLAGV